MQTQNHIFINVDLVERASVSTGASGTPEKNYISVLRKSSCSRGFGGRGKKRIGKVDLLYAYKQENQAEIKLP